MWNVNVCFSQSVGCAVWAGYSAMLHVARLSSQWDRWRFDVSLYPIFWKDGKVMCRFLRITKLNRIVCLCWEKRSPSESVRTHVLYMSRYIYAVYTFTFIALVHMFVMYTCMQTQDRRTETSVHNCADIFQDEKPILVHNKTFHVFVHPNIMATSNIILNLPTMITCNLCVINVQKY